MKRIWEITIETKSDGTVSVLADTWNPSGILSDEERKALSQFLEPFVSKE